MPGNAWNRQDGETPRAFHAFTCYRDMPPSRRSLAAVVANCSTVTVKLRQVSDYSVKSDWVARAAAYDAHLDQVRLDRQREAIIEMAERQAEQGRQLQVVGMAKFINPKTGKPRKTAVSGMDDNDAIRAVDVGAKIERTARGEPTEITKADYTHKLKPMSDYTKEELEQIAQTGHLPPPNDKP